VGRTGTFKVLAEALLGSHFVLAALHQDIEHGALLFHSPPEIVVFAINRQKYLMQLPFVAWPGRRR
jgi:hypothetical protein